MSLRIFESICGVMQRKEEHRLTLTLATLGYAALLAKNSRST